MPGSSRLSRRRLYLIGAALLTALLGSSGLYVAQNQPTAAPVTIKAKTDDLITILRAIGSGVDFAPSKSPEDLASRASLTVLGTISAVVDGRVFGVGPSVQIEPAFRTIGMMVKIERIVAGDETLLEDDTAYVEMIRPKSLSIESVAAATPDGQRALLFLDDYSDGPRPFSLLQDSAIGRRGAVFAPYIDGFLLENQASGAVTGGLEPLEEMGPNWLRDITSLNSFVETHFPVGSP